MVNGIAGRDEPADHLRLVNAFAELGQVKVHDALNFRMQISDCKLTGRFFNLQSEICNPQFSCCFRRQFAHRLQHVRELRHFIPFVHLVQTDPRDVRSEQHPRTGYQIVEVLVRHAAEQVLAEVGHFGVFVHDQHSPGFQQRWR